ncbi:esterase/lipase family protein [Desulfurivibrio sp. D14AmB]|uniref:esterase/lipase family protein n=1 Tax=Desulfurivibrio sp. D14AmB TaxID=3374370 RepID=UPI00376EE97F
MPANRPMVVLIHGIWMTGFEMALLGRRLRAAGFSTRRFPYSSLRTTPERNADDLAKFIDRLPQQTVHLVGHSLGGRISELLLRRHPRLAKRLGRVVTLGTPFAGSHIARLLARNPVSRLLLGKAGPTLVSAVSSWDHKPPLGVIAGDCGPGIGHLIPAMPKPHDGTVALAETVIAGATARTTIPHGHLPMLFQGRVAALVAKFLQTGTFD